MLNKHFKIVLFKIIGAATAAAILIGVFYLLLIQLTPVAGPVQPAQRPVSGLVTYPSPETETPSVQLVLVSGIVEHSEMGAIASLKVTPGGCAQPSPVSSFNKSQHLRSDELPEMQLVSEICVATSATAPSLSPLTPLGAWVGPSEEALPELDYAIEAWEYQTTAGKTRKIVAVSVGYCESPAWGCSTALALRELGGNERPFAVMELAEYGMLPLVFTP